MTSITRNRNRLLQRLRDVHSKSQRYFTGEHILLLTLTFIRSVSDNMKKIEDEFKHICFTGTYCLHFARYIFNL